MNQACEYLVRRKVRNGEYVHETCGKVAKFVVERAFSRVASVVCASHVPPTRLGAQGVGARPFSEQSKPNDVHGHSRAAESVDERP